MRRRIKTEYDIITRIVSGVETRLHIPVCGEKQKCERRQEQLEALNELKEYTEEKHAYK